MTILQWITMTIPPAMFGGITGYFVRPKWASLLLCIFLCIVWTILYTLAIRGY